MGVRDPAFQPSVLPQGLGIDPAEIDRLIEADRLETLYANTPQALPGGLLFAALLAWAEAAHAGSGLALAWLLAKWLVIGARWLDWRQFNHDPQRRARVARWRRRHGVGALLDGIGWGLGAVLFIPSGDPLLDGALLAGLVGVAAIGVFTLTSHMTHAVGFMAGSLMPLAIHELVLQRGPASLLTAGGLTVYLLVLWLEGRRAHQHKTELLRLRFENAAIADDREAALRRVEDASLAKSRFLATVSHELRTPLNGIMGMAELISTPSTEHLRQERVEVVRQSAAHLLALIDDLLDVSRIEFGRFELHPESTRLRPLVHEVTDLLTPLAAARGLRLSLQIEAGVPEAALLDGPRVRQVLHNLLGNALKFTEQGDIALTLARRADLLQFTVRDSGRGIAPALLERIFDAFERGEEGRSTAGTGLGLTISRQLARAMGGNLTASSRPGEGAVFVFTLGCREAPPPPAGPEAAAAGAAPPALQGVVLLVEDNPVNAMVAQGMLERLGLQVRQAGDGAQALDELQRQRPDLVLMDCQMPVLDGWEATRRWRGHEQRHQLPRLPVIALTANAVPGDREHCLAAGMDDYLAKPITLDALAAVLRPHLGQAAPTR